MEERNRSGRWRRVQVFEKINAAPAESPIAPHAAGQTGKHGRLRTAGYRNAPQSAFRRSLAVVDILAIHGFESGEAAICRHLLCGSGRDRLFPDLPFPAAVRRKVDESAVA